MEKFRETLKIVVQKAGPLRLLAVAACGVLLIALSWGNPFSKDQAGTGKTAGETGNAAGETDGEYGTSRTEYKAAMERELKDILERVEGVGRAEVMVTLRGSEEKVTLKDNASGGGRLEEETVLIEDENRNSSPYVVMEKEPEIEGVVVVCDGGEDAVIRREVTEAVCALFQIESHKIKVMKSKEAKE